MRVALRAKFVLAVVASVSLVLGVVSPANAGGVPPQSSAAAAVSIPVGQVPPLPVVKGVAPVPNSTGNNAGAPAVNLVAKPPVPPVDLKPSLSPSAAFDQATSVALSRDAHGTLFRNKDGSQTRVNRPGLCGGSDSPKDDDHASITEVSAGVAGSSCSARL